MAVRNVRPVEQASIAGEFLWLKNIISKISEWDLVPKFKLIFQNAHLQTGQELGKFPFNGFKESKIYKIFTSFAIV